MASALRDRTSLCVVGDVALPQADGVVVDPGVHLVDAAVLLLRYAPVAALDEVPDSAKTGVSNEISTENAERD